MRVTETEREKGHLLKLLLDGGGELLLDLDFCNEKRIGAGSEITPSQIKEYKAESDYRRAKSRALWLLDRYVYSERRLYEKLIKAGFGGEPSAKAVARLKELGLIDDASLALRTAQDLSRRGVSKREAYGKLLAKGIPAPVVKEALENGEFDEREQIAQLIERKYARQLAAGETQKVYAALCRKGFSFSAVRDVLKKHSEELEYSEDF